MKIVCAEITSWIGLSIGATHYYLKINERECTKKIELQHILTHKQAAELNKQERKEGSDYRYKKGDKYKGFWTKEDAKKRAVRYFKENYSTNDILLCGSASTKSVQECLHYKDIKIMNRINVLYQRADEIEYYNKIEHEKEMEQIDKEYESIIKRLHENTA